MNQPNPSQATGNLQEPKSAPAPTPAAARLPAYTDTIDLVALFYLFLRHIWQILLCLVLGGAIAFGWTYYMITPQYQTSTKLYILASASDSILNLSDLQLGTQLSADYVELLKSRPILEEVAQNLSLPYSAEQLGKMVSITKTNDTRILKITATGPNPQECADIANEIAEQSREFLPKIMGAAPPNIVETALVPTVKYSPSYSRNAMMGALVGAMLYCAFLAIPFLMNDRIVTPDDVAQCFGVQPLAVIPEGDLGAFNRSNKKKKKKKGAAK